MLKCQIMPSGDLFVAADNETREDISDAIESGKDYLSILCDIFEGYSCNGSYTPFDSSEGNPFVGLTSAPCIAESLSVEDNGDLNIDGRLWWFPNYMLHDPIIELRNKGETVFKAAE